LPPAGNHPAITTQQPMPTQDLGRWIIAAGLILVGIGAYLLLGGRLPPLFRLPGDIVWQNGTTTIYIPITTMILLSVAFTLVLQIVGAVTRR
jgi:hypothetical protein